MLSSQGPFLDGPSTTYSLPKSFHSWLLLILWDFRSISHSRVFPFTSPWLIYSMTFIYHHHEPIIIWNYLCYLFACWIIPLGVSLGAQMVKNLSAVWETRVQSWIGKIPWRRKWQPSLVFLLEKFHGQRSLVGYSPWDCKELDTIDDAGHCSLPFHEKASCMRVGTLYFFVCACILKA